jgi:hypothetical protein
MLTALLAADDEAVRSTSQLPGWQTISRRLVGTNFVYYDFRKSLTLMISAFILSPLRWLKEPRWQN